MEKQTLFLFAVTGLGAVGSFVWGPYVGLVLYFAFAVLRPQYLWRLTAPSVGEYQWSLYAAAAVVLTAAFTRFGLVRYPSAGPTAGARVPPWNAVHWLMLLFMGWMTLSYAFAEDHERAWPTFDIYLKVALMFVVGGLCVYRLSQFWVLLAVLAVMDVYVAYEANYAYFAWGRNDIHLNGFGWMDNNGAGLMIAMGLPLCYFLWEGTRGWYRWGYLFATPVLAHAVQLTFSRGAMVSAILTLPVIFVFSRHKRWMLLFAAAGAAFVIGTSGPELRERFFSIEKHEMDASAESRKMAWTAAVEIANGQPFFGVGLRNSAPHMEKHGAPKGMTIHSQYLQLAADSGWFGMAIYIAFYAAAVWLGVRTWWALRRYPEYPEVRQARALAAGLTSGLVLYGVGAVFLSLETFELPYILLLLVAQLWNCLKGGGIEAAVAANGSVLPTRAVFRRPMTAVVPPRPRVTVPTPAALP